MTIGIYCIENTINGKRYIGKSVNIERRRAQHKCWLIKSNRNPKTTNMYLYRSVQKYGWSVFTIYILESFGHVDERLITERELYWMDHYKTCDPDFGYNLRRDSSTGMVVNELTRQLQSKVQTGEGNNNFGFRWSDEMKTSMSSIKKDQHNNGRIYTQEWREKIGKSASQFWADNPEIKEQMSAKVAINRRRYKFRQLNETGDLIREWSSIDEILSENPSWKWQNIYSVCNGYKKRIYGFKWESVPL